MLYGEFDLVAFDGDDAGFVIAVASGAGTAEDFIAVGFESGRQGVDGFFAADGKGDVGVAGAGQGFDRVGEVRAGHEFQAGAGGEGKEVGAETRGGVVVKGAGVGAKVGDEEGLGGVEVIYIEDNVVDGHISSFPFPSGALSSFYVSSQISLNNMAISSIIGHITDSPKSVIS